MQHEKAEVAYIKGDYAFLSVKNNTSCGECSSKASCGSIKLFNPIATDSTFKVENNIGLEVGDAVQISLPPNKLIHGTLLVYIFPLVSLFMFSAIGKLLGGEAVSVIAGLGGLLAALILVKKFLSKKLVSSQFTPKVMSLTSTQG